MAAIERGELTAVGLPEVPGAEMFGDAGPGDGGAAAAAAAGGGVGRSAPALEQVVKNLPRIQACMERSSSTNKLYDTSIISYELRIFLFYKMLIIC